MAKSTKKRLHSGTFIAFFWVVASATGICQVVPPIQQSADSIASALRKADRKKVAVLPLLFLEDKSKEQRARERAEYDSETKVEEARPVLSISRDSLRLAEQMQAYLSQSGRGDFRVVPTDELMDRLGEQKGTIGKLKPTFKELNSLVNPEGDIDAYVVGILRKELDEVKHVNGGFVLGPEQVGCEWKVMDTGDRTLIVSKVNEPNYISLAEAVYNGLSMEFFRYQNGRLTCLLDYQQKDRKDVPLLPSDAEVLYSKGSISTSRVHPLLNPNCPLKVQFSVDDRVLPIHVAESNVFGGPAILPHVVVNMEPGDEPVIRVSNTLPHRVIVAVFVDGVNVLGKARELPDQNCHSWVLEPKGKLNFDSWWTIEGDQKFQYGSFKIQDWAESVAGKIGLQGDADSSRAITIVFYTDGFADRNSLAFFERTWVQRASLTPNRQTVQVTEQLVSPNNVGAAPNMFGMGEKRPVPGQLQWVKDAKVGTMLASMTVWYCPSSDTKRMFKQLIEKDGGVMGKHISIVPVSIGR